MSICHEAFFSEDVIKDLLELLKEEQDVPDINVGKWIPCSERLPEDNIDVLVCDREEDIYLSHMTRHKKFFDVYGDEIKGLIAWMPLPEPYRDEHK